ncbi:MAG: Acetone carboxylase gamma subunit, partial [Deltaproteobacteria bacterium]|nr:Acetone carboxylase gamma subunit [Deltaproteobacteria bacterium]
LGEYLEIVEIAGRNLITCRKCSHVFCKADDNPKESAVLNKSPLAERSYLAPHWKTDASLEIIGKLSVLEFACPGCATVFALDVAEEGEPFMADVVLRR